MLITPSSQSGSRLCAFFLVVGIVGIAIVTGCRLRDVPIWQLHNSVDQKKVKIIRNVSYHPDTDTYRNTLDLYLPRDKKNCPVVVLVHGGSWLAGDNRCYGLYSSVGTFLASRGIVAVLPNYRLSPHVKHPTHAEDVARAIAWTHANVEHHCGRPDQIFLLGHSAGGHLVSLVATDERYLKAHELSTDDLKGVISLSGVYRIPPGSVDVRLGGRGEDGLRMDKMFPVRSSGSASKLAMKGIPCSINVFGITFGEDEELRADASPITHVRPGLPPFLLLHADNDIPLIPDQATEFHNALKKNGCESQLYLVPERNHNSIMFQAYQDEDPVAQAVLEFIRKHTTDGSRKR